ncbi:MAG: OFA family MFS transporter [Acidobacteriia bacterium]|nr:OFA family MFS transporter [Terriglobia bacterium]
MTATIPHSDALPRSNAPSAVAGGERAEISRWWRLIGGLLMTLALGTLYAWSVFVAPLEREFGWKRAQTSTVFTFAVVMFAASLLLAGKLQDRFGPFWISLTGSILITLSFLLFAYTSSLYYLYFFYGVLGGIGNGFGYGTVVPVMAKWFPDKTGLAIGLALAGYGGGSAIFGTFANLVLFPHFGWRPSCMILSAMFLVMTMTGAFLMKNPPANRPPEDRTAAFRVPVIRHQFMPNEVLRTPAFYLLWLGFGLGSTAGLMVISQLIPFANNQGISSATIATMGLVVGASGNVSGRIFAGWISDLLGRLNTLRVVLLISTFAMPALYWVGAHIAGLYALIFIVYFCYGTQASVNPATIADFYGTRHAGTNYGMVFTAWGFAGILGPTIGGVLFDRYRNYGAAFYTAAVLALIAFICVMVARRPSSPAIASS